MNLRSSLLGLAVVGISLGSETPLFGAPVLPANKAFETEIEPGALDGATYAEWVDGEERALEVVDEDGKSKRDSSPLWVTATTEGGPTGFSGIKFGESKSAGLRHLRIGFTSPVAVGTVITMGGGRLSALKAGGDLSAFSDESQWIPGERLVNGRVSNSEVDTDSFGVWVFPPGTNTEALRFTHEVKPTDARYSGHLKYVLVSKERFANLAPTAQISTNAEAKNVERLTNEANDGWGAWASFDYDKARAGEGKVISEAEAPFATLVWEKPVKLNSLVTMWSLFDSASVEIFTGGENTLPQEAGDQDWKRVGEYSEIKSGYPGVWPARLRLPEGMETRAVRFKITKPAIEASLHPHLPDKVQGGRRAMLGELMALHSLGDAPLSSVESAPPKAAEAEQPPIPVRFSLKEAGWVTLVIENADGVRIRNLVSETYFPAGENIAWWDGLDDLGRDKEAYAKGLYSIPGRLVSPGEYRVKGLVRGALDAKLEFTLYSAGKPGWNTTDNTGAWLSNHCAPMAALFVPAEFSPTKAPAVYLGSYVTEGTHGLAWVDLEGRKQGGFFWLGGTWTGAAYLARDEGVASLAEAGGVIAYAMATASVGEKNDKRGELRISPVKAEKTETKESILITIASEDLSKIHEEVGGLAVYRGTAVCSLPLQKKLLFVDLGSRSVKGEVPLDEKPTGLAFDRSGALYLLKGNSLLKYAQAKDLANLPAPEVLVSGKLDAPSHVTLDEVGNFYISNRGTSHHVKVFDPKGKAIGVIGKKGVPKAGPYDPLRMNNPAGLTVDSKGQVWVTEDDYLPKRVSVWTKAGKLVNAFYGPTKYGGGGTIDVRDSSKFYYAEEMGAMEFKIDWKKGQTDLISVIYRTDEKSLPLGVRNNGPETAFYVEGRRYFTNAFNSNPVGGTGVAFIFRDEKGVAIPCAAAGNLRLWKVLEGEEFKPFYPEGFDLGKRRDLFFLWSDTNGDVKVQPEEVQFLDKQGNGIVVMPDLTFTVAVLGGETMAFTSVQFTDAGVPQYRLDQGKVLATNARPSASSGGNQALIGPDGWAVMTVPVGDFEPYSLCGTKDGKALWSYPSLWPGLHASHSAPEPDRPGMLIGTTRLVGGMFTPNGTDAGPMWAVNGNHGNIYVFTYDGLLVATYFKDMRVPGTRWRMPAVPRGTSMISTTLNDENFWPGIATANGGQVYLINSSAGTLLKLEGLETARRIPESSLTLKEEDLAKATAFQTQTEAKRQQTAGRGVLRIKLGNGAAPNVDGNLSDWESASWVDIEKRGARAYFDSNSKPYDITGSVRVSGDRLYAAFKTQNPRILENSGDAPTALFKTGGALDLMIGANGAAAPDRTKPVEGDQRLLVSLVKGKPKALLYRAVVPNTKPEEKVSFSSPWRTITLDAVTDVTDQVQFAGDKGNYEISIPLSALGLKPTPGMTISGDIGVLRGDGFVTTARSYWNNKATALVSDVPGEAMLVPHLWGKWTFEE